MRISSVYCLKPRRGFTLIELLMTLAVLSVLATVVVPVVQVSQQREKEHNLRLALREIRQAIDVYKRASDAGRIRKTLGATGYPPSLNRLVEGEDDQTDPRRHKLFFLRRVPRDPMSDLPGDAPAELTWALRSYASEAASPQAGDDVFDVISRSTTSGLNGVPYRLW